MMGGEKPISPNDPKITRIAGITNTVIKDVERFIFEAVNRAIIQGLKIYGGRRIEVEISKIGIYIEKDRDIVLPENWIDHVVKKYEETGWTVTKHTTHISGDYLIFSRTPPPTEIEKQQQREKRLRSDDAKK